MMTWLYWNRIAIATIASGALALKPFILAAEEASSCSSDVVTAIHRAAATARRVALRASRRGRNQSDYAVVDIVKNGRPSLSQCRRCAHQAVLTAAALTEPKQNHTKPSARKGRRLRGSTSVGAAHSLRASENGAPATQAFATSLTNRTQTEQHCLRVVPCCDCEACKKGWSSDKYPLDPAVGLDCESACSRCRALGTFATASVMHPRSQRRVLRRAKVVSKKLSQLSPSAANQKVERLLPSEVTALAAEILDRPAGGGLTDALCRLGADLHDDTSNALAQAVMLMTDRESTVSVREACAASQWTCGGSVACSAFARKLAKAQAISANAMRHVFTGERFLSLCTNRSEMLMAVGLVSECPGPMSPAVFQGMREVLEDLPDEGYCSRARMLFSSAFGRILAPVKTPPACKRARERCAASVGCKPTLHTLNNGSLSPESILGETLKLCSNKNDVLLILNVTAECPGLLPQKEMRESRDALAQLEQKDMCGKMTELVDVLGLLFRPTPSAKCLSARRECAKDLHCVVTSDTAGRASAGSLSMSFDAALSLCDHKESLFSALRVVTACPESLSHPGSVGFALEAQKMLQSVPEGDLCSEATSVKSRLFGALGPAETEPPSAACAAARESCSASAASPCSLVMGDDAPRLIQALPGLCQSQQALEAALNEVMACSGHAEREQARRLKRSLAAVIHPGANRSLCSETLNIIAEDAAVFAPAPVALSLRCVEAHQECARLGSVRCRRLRSSHMQAGPQLFDMLEYCRKDRSGFDAAMRIEKECSGAWRRERGGGIKLPHVNQSDAICDQLESLELLDNVANDPAQSFATQKLTNIAAFGMDDSVSGIISAFARRVIAAVDFAPRDGRLNDLELQILQWAIASNVVAKSAGKESSKLNDRLRVYSDAVINAALTRLSHPGVLDIHALTAGRKGIRKNSRRLHDDGDTFTVDEHEIATALIPSMTKAFNSQLKAASRAITSETIGVFH